MAWSRVIDVALFNHYGNYQTKFAVDLDIGEENITGNYTPIKRRMVIYVTGGTVQDASVSGYIDGYRVYADGGTYSTDGTTVWEDSVNVYHDNDGTKYYSISGRVRFNNWGIEGSGTGGRQLTNIPRAAKITACVDFTDEDNPTISISNLGGFNMEGWLEPNPNSEHLATRTIPTNAKTYTWVLTDAERKQLRAKCTSNQCTIRVGLYSKDKAFVDYKDVKYDIINADPVFNTASFATQNNLTLADNLTIIKGYSTIKVTLGKATAQKEATIESYKVICGSVMKTGTEITYTLENVDDSIIRCYATDSRGNTTEKIINVTKYIDYVPITADLLEYERSDGGIGKGVTITFKGNLWVGNFGKLSNTITAQYFYKKRGATTWTQGTTAINPTVLANYTKTVSIRGDLGASGFDNAYDYDIKVIVSDRLSNDEVISIISKGQPHLDFCQYGIALGGRYDESVLVNGERDPLQIYSPKLDKMIAGAFLSMYDETTKEIKTIDGNVIGVGAFQYSTSEQWTGKYWLDGKKIYTKTITVPALKNADKTIAHNIGNIGDYRTTDFTNSYLKAGTNRYHLPRISRGNANQQVAVNITPTLLEIVVGTDAGFEGGYITIRYTCTDR